MVLLHIYLIGALITMVLVAIMGGVLDDKDCISAAFKAGIFWPITVPAMISRAIRYLVSGS